MSDLFTPEQIGEECKVSQWMVTRYLRANYKKHKIKHDYKCYWRLSPDEYAAVCATLKSAKLACPDQPLHALNSPQKFIVFG